MNIILHMKCATLSFLLLCISCTPYKNIAEGKLWFGNDFANYYLLASNKGRSGEKLIIYLNGSGVTSALGEKGSFSWKSTTPAYYLWQQSPSNFDVLVPEYRNVRIGVSHKNDWRAYEHYTLDERVSTAVRIIDHFLGKNHYQAVYIIGHSEGALILPRVYRELQSRSLISGVVLMSYGGMSQYECFQLLVNKFGFLKNTYLAGLRDMDQTIERIYQDPLSMDNWWLGLPYRRWSSFGPYRPIEDLLQIDIPILLTHGSKDILAPVESSRMVVDEFRKVGKMNVTYKEYANNTHSYNEGDFSQVIRDINAWLP